MSKIRGRYQIVGEGVHLHWRENCLAKGKC